MADGATLNFLDDYSSPANVSSGSGKYAGALVGYAENADITVESGHAVTLSKTVTGGAGAGGLYGYYKSSGSDRVFELESYTSDASFTIAGGTSQYTLGDSVIVISAAEMNIQRFNDIVA